MPIFLSVVYLTVTEDGDEEEYHSIEIAESKDTAIKEIFEKIKKNYVVVTGKKISDNTIKKKISENIKEITKSYFVHKSYVCCPGSIAPKIDSEYID